MNSKSTIKAKRHKKTKSRTQVSSDSESEPERNEVKPEESDETTPTSPKTSKDMSDAEVKAAFTKFYMQRATTEFSEDLDKMRGADDFKEDALPLLINALQQGTTLFSIKEQRRIVTAGMEKVKKKGGD